MYRFCCQNWSFASSKCPLAVGYYPAFHHRPRPAQGLRENRRVGAGLAVCLCKPMTVKVNGIGCQGSKNPWFSCSLENQGYYVAQSVIDARVYEVPNVGRKFFVR